MKVKRSSDKKFQNYKRTFRTETVVLGAVERHILTRAIAKSTRASDVIHPSEIVKKDVCPRQIYYRIIGTPADVDSVDPSFWTERIFEEGHDIHEKWQGWLWDMGKLYGYFKCLVCDHYWYQKSPTACRKCGAPREKLVYKEVPVDNDEHNIHGHADAQVDEGLIEVKSVGKGTVRLLAPGFYERFQSGEWTEQELWNNIKRPFPEHTKQGMIYCFCKGIDTLIVIYECKWNQAVKEFTLHFNAKLIEPVLDLCLDIQYAVKKKRRPSRPEWAHENAPACKACPYKKVCYEGQAKAAVTRKRPKAKRVARAQAS